MAAPGGGADALTRGLFGAMTSAGGSSQPSAAAQAAALQLLDPRFPELLHFSAGADVAASPAFENPDAARGEYYRTTGAMLALAASLAAAAAPENMQAALELVRRGAPRALRPQLGRGIRAASSHAKVP